MSGLRRLDQPLLLSILSHWNCLIWYRQGWQNASSFESAVDFAIRCRDVHLVHDRQYVHISLLNSLAGRIKSGDSTCRRGDAVGLQLLLRLRRSQLLGLFRRIRIRLVGIPEMVSDISNDLPGHLCLSVDYIYRCCVVLLLVEQVLLLE